MRARVRAAAVLTAVLLASGCGDPVAPLPSDYVTLSGAPAPRTVSFRFVGQHADIAAATAGATVFTGVPAGDTVSVIVIAPAGQVLSGAVARVQVPNITTAVAKDSVRLLQVATPDYVLQTTLIYSMKVQAQLP